MSRRLLTLLVLLSLSALGLLIAALVGLWRDVQSAEETARGQVRDADRVRARELRTRLGDAEFMATLPTQFRFRIEGAEIVAPAWMGWIGSAPSVVELSPTTLAILRESEKLERSGQIPAARKKLGTIPERGDHQEVDRFRLALAEVWLLHRRDDPQTARAAFEKLPTIDPMRYPTLAANRWALLVALGVAADDADAAALGLIDPVSQAGAWHRIEERAQKQGSHPSYRRALMGEEGVSRGAAFVTRRRAELQQFSSQASRLASIREAYFERAESGDYVLWIPTSTNAASGEAALLPQEILARQLESWLGNEDLAVEGTTDQGEFIADGLSLVRKEAASFEKRGLGFLGAALFGLAILFFGALFFTVRALRQEARSHRLRAEFTTSVTHELKTPLASIRLLAEMLEEERVKDPERRREYHRRLASESARLAMLVENVLDLGRLEKGERAYDRREASLDEVVAETLDLFRPLAERDGVILEHELNAPNFLATVDKSAMAQVLLNLLDNARKYASQGKKLRVTTRVEKNLHVLELRDFGGGIAAEEREEILSRFVRGEDQKSGKIPGVGLGLYLSRRILRDHGGDLKAIAPPEGESGARFVWQLKESLHGADSDR